MKKCVVKETLENTQNGIVKSFEGGKLKDQKKVNNYGTTQALLLLPFQNPDVNIGLAKNIASRFGLKEMDPGVKDILDILSNVHRRGVIAEQMANARIAYRADRFEKILGTLSDNEKKELTKLWALADYKQDVSVFDQASDRIKAVKDYITKEMREIHKNANSINKEYGLEEIEELPDWYFPHQLDPSVKNMWVRTADGRMMFGATNSVKEERRAEDAYRTMKLWERVKDTLPDKFKDVDPGFFYKAIKNESGFFNKDYKALKNEVMKLYGGKSPEQLDVMIEERELGLREIKRLMYEQRKELQTAMRNQFKKDFEQQYKPMPEDVKAEMKLFNEGLKGRYTADEYREFMKNMKIDTTLKNKKGQSLDDVLNNMLDDEFYKNLKRGSNEDVNAMLKEKGLPTLEDLRKREILQSEANNWFEMKNKDVFNHRNKSDQQVIELRKQYLKQRAEFKKMLNKMTNEELLEYVKQENPDWLHSTLDDLNDKYSGNFTPKARIPRNKEEVFQERITKEKLASPMIVRQNKMLLWKTDDLEQILSNYNRSIHRKVWYDWYLNDVKQSLSSLDYMKSKGVDTTLLKKLAVRNANYLTGQVNYYDNVVSQWLYSTPFGSSPTPYTDAAGSLRNFISKVMVKANPSSAMVNLTQTAGNLPIYGVKASGQAYMDFMADMIKRWKGEDVPTLDFIDHLGFGNVQNVLDDVNKVSGINTSTIKKLIGIGKDEQGGLLNLFDAFGKSEKANRIITFYAWKRWMKEQGFEDVVELWSKGGFNLDDPLSWEGKIGNEFRDSWINEGGNFEQAIGRSIEGVNATNFNYGKSNKPLMLQDPFMDFFFGQFQTYGISQAGRDLRMFTRWTMKPDPDNLYNLYQLPTEWMQQITLGGVRAGQFFGSVGATIPFLGATGAIGAGLSTIGINPNKAAQNYVKNLEVEINRKINSGEWEKTGATDLLQFMVKAMELGLPEAVTGRSFSSKFAQNIDEGGKDGSARKTPGFKVVEDMRQYLFSKEGADKKRAADDIAYTLYPTFIMNIIKTAYELKQDYQDRNEPVPDSVDFVVEKLGEQYLKIDNLARQDGYNNEAFTVEFRNLLNRFGVKDEFLNKFNTASIYSRLLGLNPTNKQQVLDITNALYERNKERRGIVKDEENRIANVYKKMLESGIDETTANKYLSEEITKVYEEKGIKLSGKTIAQDVMLSEDRSMSVLKGIKATGKVYREGEMTEIEKSGGFGVIAHDGLTKAKTEEEKRRFAVFFMNTFGKFINSINPKDREEILRLIKQ